MKKYNQKSKTAIYPISFKDFDVFEFYNEYKNLKRIYLFNLLNEFNFISEHNGTLSITFDTLTKIGLFLQNIDVKNRGNYNSCSLAQVSKLNKIFIEFVLNSRIGHAMPIFKYDNEIYTICK